MQVKASRAEAGETMMFDHDYARFVTVVEPIDSSAMKGVTANYKARHVVSSCCLLVAYYCKFLGNSNCCFGPFPALVLIFFFEQGEGPRRPHNISYIKTWHVKNKDAAFAILA
jgi:hypothetical protein